MFPAKCERKYSSCTSTTLPRPQVSPEPEHLEIGNTGRVAQGQRKLHGCQSLSRLTFSFDAPEFNKLRASCPRDSDEQHSTKVQPPFPSCGRDDTTTSGSFKSAADILNTNPSPLICFSCSASFLSLSLPTVHREPPLPKPEERRDRRNRRAKPKKKNKRTMTMGKLGVARHGKESSRRRGIRGAIYAAEPRTGRSIASHASGSVVLRDVFRRAFSSIRRVIRWEF